MIIPANWNTENKGSVYVKSERLVAEDIMRDAGYMPPQSNNAHELLEELILKSPDGFPVETAKKLLNMIPNNENEKKEVKAMKKWVCSVCGYVRWLC